ncbi:phospholipase D family protein [Thioalkalivibrio sp. ALJ24]|uniref:phospholipase D family protein n=1 Tax=Thioalkalivibrio sp. ALJ24 TaxID=545276 RepID=UPI0004765985|nr:phospholipase D family protein [Thioalkalivibrio sp. ALJ24]
MGSRIRLRASITGLAVLLLASACAPLEPRGERPSNPPPVEPAAEGPLAEWLAPRLADAPDESGLRLLDDAVEAFQWRAFSARKARETLHVQYYIWRNDAAGRALLGELLRAADRGVEVSVLLDDIDARGRDDVLSAVDEHPNIDIRLFNPFRTRGGLFGQSAEFLVRGVLLNRRMHNKAWVADGHLAIIGGRNIGDEYFDASPEYNFADLDVAIAGPMAVEVDASFQTYWNSRGAIDIAQVTSRSPDPERLQKHREALQDWLSTQNDHPLLQKTPAGRLPPGHIDADDAYVWTRAADFVVDPPAKALDGREFDAERDDGVTSALRARLAGVSDELRIISPYFVPRRQGTRELVELAESGARVSVLTNSLASNDVVFTHSGYSRRRSALLRGGVELHELRPTALPNGEERAQRWGVGSSQTSLHTKAFVMDGHEAFVGSYNLDPRSAYSNTESGVFLRDPALVGQVVEMHERIIQPEFSYQVELDSEGNLLWRDDAGRTWNRDPKAGPMRQILSDFTILFPVERLL